MIWVQAVIWVRAVGGHVWVHDCTSARTCVGVCGSWYYWRSCCYQGFDKPPETMLVSSGHAAVRATLIWVVCAATRAMLGSRHMPCQEPFLGPWFCCNWGLCGSSHPVLQQGFTRKKMLIEMWGLCWVGLPFTGLGIAGPGTYCTLQEESSSY